MYLLKCIREDDVLVSDYFELSISVESRWNEFGMRDCMKLLISSFLDNYTL